VSLRAVGPDQPDLACARVRDPLPVRRPRRCGLDREPSVGENAICVCSRFHAGATSKACTARQLPSAGAVRLDEEEVVAGAPVAGEDEGGVGRGRGSRGCNGGGGRNDGCGEARLMSPMIATSCQPFPRKR
jgi:hypothetical protein